jgi:hypothetical protein
MNVLMLDGSAFSGRQGIFGVDVARAASAGLRARPLEETVRATRTWYAQADRTSLGAGLDPQREMELLDSWNAAI